MDSTIPKGGGQETWVYPSEQMFFNALHRKGKGEGVTEESMSSVVAIHNNMNEGAWREVLRWEALHSAKCDAPTLLRFMGRPHELTNKAAFKYYTGLAPRPFDRHDWTVDRCAHSCAPSVSNLRGLLTVCAFIGLAQVWGAGEICH